MHPARLPDGAGSVACAKPPRSSRTPGLDGHWDRLEQNLRQDGAKFVPAREGVPLLVIQRRLGHADLAITSAYLRRIDNTEIIHTVHERLAPIDSRHQSPQTHTLIATGPASATRPGARTTRPSPNQSSAEGRSADECDRSRPPRLPRAKRLDHECRDVGRSG